MAEQDIRANLDRLGAVQRKNGWLYMPREATIAVVEPKASEQEAEDWEVVRDDWDVKA